MRLCQLIIIKIILIIKKTSKKLLDIKTFLNKRESYPVEKLPKIMNLVNELNDIIFGKKE